MAVNNMFPVLDGITPSWADIRVLSASSAGTMLDVKDIKSIHTGGALTIGKKKGASGGRVISRTTGEMVYEASWVLYHDGYVKLLRNLKAAAQAQRFVRGNQVLVGLVSFGIQIQFTPPGSSEIFDRRIKGVRVAGFTGDAAEGSEANEVEVPLDVLEIAEMVDGVEVVYL